MARITVLKQGRNTGTCTAGSKILAGEGEKQRGVNYNEFPRGVLYISSYSISFFLVPRVAVDSFAIQMIQSYGAKNKLSKFPYPFLVPQVRRAVELGLGARSITEVDVRTLNAEKSQNIS